MRIAFISTLRNSSWGGSEELWFRSALLAIKEGHDIGIFVYNYNPEPEQLSILKSKGSIIFKRNKKDSFRIKLFRRLIVYFGFEKDQFWNPYKPLLKFNPEKIVVTDGATYYSSNDQYLRNLLLNYFAKKYIIISQGNSPYHLPSDRKTALMFFSSAQTIVFVSKNNQDLTFHQLTQKLENSFVIQNPIILDSFEQRQMPPISDNLPIQCAVVGRLCISDKGQDIIIAMMANPFWQNANLLINIYGSGEDETYLMDLIKFYGVQDKVFLKGYKTPNEIWSSCHCLIMPSNIEGTPLTLLEAMVFGRVCIVTDVGGNSEWIEDGVNGFLVPAPTLKLMDEKMRLAISQLSDWPKIATAAYFAIKNRINLNPGRTLLNLIKD